MCDQAALHGAGGTEPFSGGKKYMKSNEVIKYIDDKSNEVINV